MFTGWKRTVVLVAAALAVGLLWVGLTTAAKPKPPAPPPPTYTMTLLPLEIYDRYGLVGTASMMWAYSMNNWGEVVGIAVTPDSWRNRGWLYSGGVTWDLADLILPQDWVSLGWRVSTPWDINDSGQIVGRLYDPQRNIYPLFRYTPTSDVLEVPNLAPSMLSGHKLAINNLGDVVGTLKRPEVGSAGAFVWKAGENNITWLLPDYGYTEGREINDAGQITGTIGPHAVNAGGRAFLYTPGEPLLVLEPLGTDVSSIPGSQIEFTLGTAINDSGQVAGTTTVKEGHRAFRYTDLVGMVNLGGLRTGRGNQTYNSEATDINLAGQVVGYSPNVGYPFLWIEANGMLDLWALIQKPLPEGAEDSTRGDIGTDYHGYALVIKDPAVGKTFGPIAGNINARSGGTVQYRAFILTPDR